MIKNNDYVNVVYNEEERPFTNYPSKLINHIIKNFSLSPNSRILEVGCGRGEFIQSFIDFGFNGYGFDISNYAKDKFPEKKFKQGDFLKGEYYDNEYFDIIFTKSFVEHFHDPEEIFEKFYSLLKKDGILITMTPEWKYNIIDFYEDYTHRTPFSKESLRDIHLITNFTEINIKSFKQLPILWNDNYFFRLLSFLAQILIPNILKKNFKFIKFSKEIMLLSYAKKK
ncbi:class I SAM-dependent methyltransferase [Alphaproteobacteria bacterium]|nr:class I SAM-dependent methyltransferase [Alphaproteobacteria bacterium]